jgi:hypothetical protein
MNVPRIPLFALLLSSCAAPAPVVAPAVAGKPDAEVSKFFSASEAKSFPCSLFEVRTSDGTDAIDLRGVPKLEASLSPGKYRVTLRCANGFGHVFKPQVDVTALAGKRYRLTGFLIDDSITIFTMKMRVKVEEIP